LLERETLDQTDAYEVAGIDQPPELEPAEEAKAAAAPMDGAGGQATA
jgi:hypothetical protein